jgi:hypothetical protein
MNTLCRPRACWQGPCPRCGGPVGYAWQQIRDSRRQVRASCQRCAGFCGYAPQREPFTTEADAAASPTATLDALVLAEQEGVEQVSDGHTVHCSPWGKVSPELEALVRQRRRLVAALLLDLSGVLTRLQAHSNRLRSSATGFGWC